jgi:hypothetical protein
MDAIEFLTQEHDKAQATFRRILQTSPDQRGAIWDELQPELEVHEQIEEACLYEPLSNDGKSTDVKYTAWKQQHQAEGRALDGLVQSLNGLLVQGPRWLGQVQAIYASFATHIRKRKTTFSPASATCGVIRASSEQGRSWS